MAGTKTRYDIRTVARIVSELQSVIEASEDTLENEESRDYPSDDKIDSLQSRIDSLQGAIDALEGIES